MIRQVRGKVLEVDAVSAVMASQGFDTLAPQGVLVAAPMSLEGLDWAAMGHAIASQGAFTFTAALGRRFLTADLWDEDGDAPVASPPSDMIGYHQMIARAVEGFGPKNIWKVNKWGNWGYCTTDWLRAYMVGAIKNIYPHQLEPIVTD